MLQYLMIGSVVCGACAAGVFGIYLGSSYERICRKKKLQGRLNGEVSRGSLHIFAQSGFSIWVLRCALRLSRSYQSVSSRVFPLWNLGIEKADKLIWQAGLYGKITHGGVAHMRRDCAFAGLLIGAVAGSILSEVLGFILAITGFIVGFRLVDKTLKKECDMRAQNLEQQLSQLLEVLVLGLSSGLSFDRSLELYGRYFSNALSREFMLTQSQWAHGLTSRAEALRNLAKTYDSTLFERTVETIVRSLRFGTSLSESLSMAAREARIVRKTQLEEKVAKAPVKMLLPVGALILPAMLILILGPILLDLMEGF